MGLTALDLGLRGAAGGLFVLMALVLLRVRPFSPYIILCLAMVAGGAAYAIATAPFVPQSSLWWTLPPLAAQPVVFWLWARATFDDDSVPTLRHGVLWLAVLGIGFASSLTWTVWPTFAHTCLEVLSAIALLLALAGAPSHAHRTIPPMTDVTTAIPERDFGEARP
jgi:hypothetical protein